MKDLQAAYPSLVKAFELLASDNGLTMRVNIQVPPAWQQRFEAADKQAGYLDGKKVGVFIDTAAYSDVDEDEDALEYMTSGEATAVEALVKEARVQTLHDLLNSAFDGNLSNDIYITGRMRHAR